MSKTKNKVVIIGAGPAGLFAAYRLHQQGIPSIIMEMGKELEDRKCPGEGECSCPNCDILEGVGGAGGFSDGKSTFSLTRGTQMEEIFNPEKDEKYLHYIRWTIKQFADNPGINFEPVMSIPSEIAKAGFKMESYPLNHLGTNGIQSFIRNYTKYLRDVGIKIMTGYNVVNLHKLVDEPGYIIKSDTPFEGEDLITAENVIIATGLQGTPWAEGLSHRLRIPMSPGPAGFGLRFEAPSNVLEHLFEIFYDFKMTYDWHDIIFRSFCCNRNGYVVNENHRTLGIRNVNGHSYLNANKSSFSNFSIIAKLTDVRRPPQDMVRVIARKINKSLGGSTAVQRVSDFLKWEPSKPDDVNDRTNKLAKAGVDIGGFLPKYLRNGFTSFLSDLCKIAPKLKHDDSLIYAPEIKYYGWKFPVNFDTWEVNGHPGLHIVGNASGYLDSFVSAALTGIIAADHIAKR